MKIDKNHPCYKKSIFRDFLDHDFQYWDKDHRECTKCSLKELYFGYSSAGEDWRRLK